MAILTKFESIKRLTPDDYAALAARTRAELICENCPYLAKCFYLRKGRSARLCPKLRTELAKGTEPHFRGLIGTRSGQDPDGGGQQNG